MKLNEQCPPHNYDEDGICYECGEDFTTYVAQLEAENKGLLQVIITASNSKDGEAVAYAYLHNEGLLDKRNQKGGGDG
jgi:hypothetical protein